MSEIAIEGQGNIPNRPVLVLPNRMNPELMRALENALGGPSRVAWIVDYNALPGESLMRHLQEVQADGFWLNLQRMSKDVISQKIHDKFNADRHVVLLPARPAQAAAGLADVEASVLNCLDGTTIPALPVYTGMYSREFSRAICTEEPYDTACMQFMPLRKEGPALGARAREAWMEAAANQLARHPLLLDGTLPEALMEAMSHNPQARLIDGVDDSDISFETLLTLSMLVGEYLRKRVLCRTIGIILPPGKFSVIANLACLFAGIVPVNFNYTATAETFRAQANLTSVNRFITERRFTLKQQSFAWPRKLDHLYLEDILRDIGTFKIRACTGLIRWGKLGFVSKRLGIPRPAPTDTAAIFFTKSVGSASKGVPMTHRMLLASALQMRSRLELQEKERVLAITPYYEPYGYLLGLLMPLLGGQDIVTYPSPDEAQRICSLSRNYSPVLTSFTPRQTYEVLAAAKEDTFAAMRYFFVTGERLSQHLFQKAWTDFKLPLYNAYTLTESALPAAFCAPTPASPTGHAIPAGTPGTAGCPPVGVAIRLVDTDNFSHVLPPTSDGCIWMRGVSLPTAYLADGKRPVAQEDMQAGWFNTGDVGHVDADGMLHVIGRRARFSKVEGVVTSHEMVEEGIHQALKLETSGPRRLAVIGLPGPQGERLILLTSIQSRDLQDATTLRYSMTNAQLPRHWAPAKIITIPSIPTLPNGQLDYEACQAIARKALGIK